MAAASADFGGRQRVLRQAVRGRPAAVSSAAPTTPSSPPPFPPHGTLFLATGARTHSEATAHCESIGGHLARVRTHAQLQLVVAEVASMSLDSAGLRRVWVDGSRVSTDASWLFSDGTPVVQLWASSQPTGGGENCIGVLHDQSDGISNFACSETMASLCESAGAFTFESPSTPPLSVPALPPPRPTGRRCRLKRRIALILKTR